MGWRGGSLSDAVILLPVLRPSTTAVISSSTSSSGSHPGSLAGTDLGASTTASTVTSSSPDLLMDTQNEKEKRPDSIRPDNKRQGQAKDVSTDFTAGAFRDTLN